MTRSFETNSLVVLALVFEGILNYCNHLSCWTIFASSLGRKITVDNCTGIQSVVSDINNGIYITVKHKLLIIQ